MLQGTKEANASWQYLKPNFKSTIYGNRIGRMIIPSTVASAHGANEQDPGGNLYLPDVLSLKHRSKTSQQHFTSLLQHVSFLTALSLSFSQ